MEYLKVYRRGYLGLVVGMILAGLTVGILMGIRRAIWQAGILDIVGWVVTAFFLTVLFGIIVSIPAVLIFESLHIWRVRRLPFGKSEGALGVHHVRKVELPLPYDKAFDLCIESLSDFKMPERDRFQGKIVAKTGMGAWTWGEIASFNVRKIDDNRTLVEVSSRPAMSTWPIIRHMAVVDYGRNLKIVERISRFLRRHAEAPYTPA